MDKPHSEVATHFAKKLYKQLLVAKVKGNYQLKVKDSNVKLIHLVADCIQFFTSIK